MDKIHLPKETDIHETAMHKCVEEVYFGTHSFTPSVTGRHNDAPVHALSEHAFPEHALSASPHKKT